MNKLSRAMLARGRGKSILVAVVPALAASAFLAASVMPAQAAPARVAAASQQNAPGTRDGAPPSGRTGPIVNYATGYCLGTQGGHNNTDVVVWTCNNSKNQTWTEQHTAQIPQPIKNGNGDCLGVAGGSTSEGAHVVAWTCQSGALNQLWTTGTGNECNINNDHYWTIQNYETGLVLGVSGASTKEGADVVMWSLQKSPSCNNQYWYWP
jgi:hypothetical protein